MQHRAPRPLTDLWRRLPRATAHSLAMVARPGHARALVTVLVLLGLGASAYATRASMVGGSSSTQSGSAGPEHPGPSGAPEVGPPELTPETPASDGPVANRKDAKSATSKAPRDEVASRAGARTTQTRLTPRETSSSPSPEVSTAADVTPPATSLSAEFPAADSAQFSFRADEAASFMCSLDGAAYTPCDSGVGYSDLDPGRHTFSVRATDAAGNVDASPAETTWQVRGNGKSDH